MSKSEAGKTRTQERYRDRRKRGLCGQCGKVRTGILARCKRCNDMLRSYRTNTPAQRAHHAKYMRKYYRANRAKYKESELRRKYGITIAEFEAMRAKQGGGCAICGAIQGEVKRKRDLFVDHDHENGKVRGLLCSQCNTALGYLRDRPKLAHAMVGYLMRWL